MPPIIISFDGNIGSGKSTIVRYFENNFAKFCNMKTYHYNICFLQEPVDIWGTITQEGKTMLELLLLMSRAIKGFLILFL